MNQHIFLNEVESFFRACKANPEHKNIVIAKIVEKQTKIALSDMGIVLDRYTTYQADNVEDISDFKNIIFLIEEAKFKDVKKAVNRMDTSPRDNIPDSVLDWYNLCQKIEILLS